MGAFTCEGVVHQTLPSELFRLQSILEVIVSSQFLSLRVLDVELLKSYVITMQSPPDKINDKLESLGQKLDSDDADVAQERPEALPVVLINIDASKSVGHLAPFVIGNDLKVVSFTT